MEEGILVPIAIPEAAMRSALAALERSRSAHPPQADLTVAVGAVTNGKRAVPRVRAAVLGGYWAATHDHIAKVVAIAHRLNKADVEALLSKQGGKLEETRSTSLRDGVAIIPIEGTIMRRLDMLSELCDVGQSTETIGQDLRTALDNPNVSGIILNIDSPGGQVNGLNELSGMIRAAAERKPVHAYIGGLGASAAYWLASNASKIVVDRTALVGSIGIMSVMEKDDDDNTIVFKSSQSPNKNLDPTTEAGAASVQSFIDEMASIFIATVAENRGMEPDAVIAAGNHGDVIFGTLAVERGLADAVGSLDSTIAELAELAAASPRPVTGRAAPQRTAEVRPAALAALAAPLAARQRDTVTAVHAAAAHVLAALKPTSHGGPVEEDNQTVVAALPAAEAEATVDPGIAALQAALDSANQERSDLARQLAESNAQVAQQRAEIGRLTSETRRKKFRDIVTGVSTAGMRWHGDIDANVTLLEQMADAFGETGAPFVAFLDSKKRDASALHETVLAETGTDLTPSINGDAKGQLEAIAEAITKEQNFASASYDQRMTEAMRRNPSLRDQFGRESQAERRAKRQSK